MKKRKRRNWSDDEKRMICVQTQVPGVSVSQVARRYDVNANLVFTWLRDDRFAPFDEPADQTRFLPVEIVDEPGQQSPSAPFQENTLVIEVFGGPRLCINGSYDPEALARLIKGLSE